MSRRAGAALMALGLVAIAGTTAYALINPNFTPGNLVEKADLILVLKIAPPDDHTGRCAAEVVRCIKGKLPANAQILDLNRTANPEHARAIRDMLAAQKGELALLFVGKGENDEPLAMLHVGGKWIALEKRASVAPKTKTKAGTPAI